MRRKHQYIECDCDSAEHVLRITVDNHLEGWGHYEPELILSTQLHQHKNIFKRIWSAIKYIFRVNERYGFWDTTILRKNDVVRLQNICYLFIKDYEKWENKNEE